MGQFGADVPSSESARQQSDRLGSGEVCPCACSWTKSIDCGLARRQRQCGLTARELMRAPTGSSASYSSSYRVE